MTDPTDTPARNVVLINVDHWPSDLFGHRGHRSVMTPTLDELARCGTAFTNAYSECPVCIPARRTLMTGTSARTHGDRNYAATMPWPETPSLAGCFSEAGYQTAAVGKLHVYPQRVRIGFDDVILSEEGRMQFGAVDDYEQYLADHGHAGEAFGHGMGNNQYHVAPWHLDDELHVTEWATRQMCRTIKRRDPTRPGFWYLSYVHPHPPLVPPQRYLDLYRDVEIEAPISGAWAVDADDLPPALRALRRRFDASYGPGETTLALRAFYALCTHIDHQLRLVVGTLREEGLLNDTVIAFTSDHGDMLGSHGLWAKRLFYQGSSCVPFLVIPAAGDQRLSGGRLDGRLAGLVDMMPTLLDLAGVEIPDSVDGISLAGDATRPTLFGEIGEGHGATRMIHDGRHKLIYYPADNRIQLFDLELDPHEVTDRANDATYGKQRFDLTQALIAELHSGDEAWAKDGALVGLEALPDDGAVPADRGLMGQRGIQFPQPPASN